MQVGFYFDQTRCTGCQTCAVVCKDWNNVEAGPARWRRVHSIEKGAYPDIFAAFLSSACWHCAAPSCVSVCPTGAIEKRPQDGIVVVEREKCQGKDNCELCLQACPYGAPQFGTEDCALMQKCDFCLDRVIKGKKPACVDGCPMRAMDTGPLEDLKDRYGDTREAEGFEYSTKSGPSVVFKPGNGINAKANTWK